MTFKSIEESEYLGEPVKLYEFSYGKARTGPFTPIRFYYTDSSNGIVYFLGKPWQPVPIIHGNLNSSGKQDRTILEVRMPINTEVAELFRFYPPDDIVYLKIFQAHLSDGNAQALAAWLGRITGVSYEKSECILSCEPVITSNRRLGLTRNYQYQCPHVLYGELCRADKETKVRGATIVATSGYSVQLNNGWNGSFSLDKYVGGVVEWRYPGFNDNQRTIIKIVNGVYLTLSGPLSGRVAGDGLRVYMGCKKTQSDCQYTHNNIQNYGGFPWIPTKNPLGIINVYN